MLLSSSLTPRESGEPVASQGGRAGGDLCSKQTKSVPLAGIGQKRRYLRWLSRPSTVAPKVTVLPNGLRLMRSTRDHQRYCERLWTGEEPGRGPGAAGKEGVDQLSRPSFLLRFREARSLAFQEASMRLAPKRRQEQTFHCRFA